MEILPKKRDSSLSSESWWIWPLSETHLFSNRSYCCTWQTQFSPSAPISPQLLPASSKGRRNPCCNCSVCLYLQPGLIRSNKCPLISLPELMKIEEGAEWRLYHPGTTVMYCTVCPVDYLLSGLWDGKQWGLFSLNQWDTEWCRVSEAYAFQFPQVCTQCYNVAEINKR